MNTSFVGPNNKLMSLLKFKKLTYFTGRNGTFKASGLEVMQVNDNILFTPITSKGLYGKCGIAIPQEEIKTLIEVLKIMIV